MIIWRTTFRTFRPLGTFPSPENIAVEEINNALYHHEGRFRQNENYCLFKYSLKGEGVFRDSDGAHRVPEGTGFLCRIDDPETSYYYPPDGNEAWRFVHCSFTGETIFSMVHELTERFGPTFKLPRNSSVINDLMSYQSNDNVESYITPHEGYYMIARLLAALLEATQRNVEQIPAMSLSMRAMETIRENIDTNINVTELADKLNVSREHLTRTFREQTSQTPLGYIRYQRMVRACRLLKETSLTGAEISARMGFDTPTHFTRVFKSVIKMTPRRFRAVGTIPLR